MHDRCGVERNKAPQSKRDRHRTDSLHQVSVGAFLPLAPDDGHDGADNADAQGARQRLWLQLAGVLRVTPAAPRAGHSTARHAGPGGKRRQNRERFNTQNTKHKTQRTHARGRE